jgi:hypothetical protein
VNVIFDAGSGDAAQIPPEVVAVRCVLGAQRLDATRAEPVHFQRLVVREQTEVAEMTMRGNEEMSGRVRVLVQHDDGVLASMHEQLFFGLAEDATVELVGLLDVLETPRRPQRLRHNAERNYPPRMTTVTTRNDDGTFDIVQRAAIGRNVSSDELQRLYWREVRSTTFGLVGFARGAIRLFGVWPALIVFAPTVDGRREITGGLFARHPYGAITWSAHDGEATVALEEFAPRLRGWLFRAEQWFHDLVGRRFLRRAGQACA